MSRVTGALAFAAALLCQLVIVALAAPSVRAAEPSFGPPSSEATLGEPIVFTSELTADTDPARVELLLAFPGRDGRQVLPATIAANGSGGWTATAVLDGHVLPNTTIGYQFRLRDGNGGVALGPADTVHVSDERFEWQTVAGPIIRLHWYNGGQDFGQRALAIGERVVAEASALLGVTETEPIDLFVYADQQPFREALGPGTRENIDGQAWSNIRTMFVLIEPHEIGDDYVDLLVAHELTHLVFNTATENVYRHAPHWLNEGIAVYLSEGMSVRWQAALADGVARDALIPLDGLSSRFAAGDYRFRLGYAQGVSAVDFFVRTYDEPTLWQLVRSYAEGLSDDDAFQRATGADLAAFNAAWMRSLDVDVPAVHGPQPGPTGPLPPGWRAGAQPTPAPSDGPTGGPTTPASPTAQPAATASGQPPATATPVVTAPSPGPTPAAEAPDGNSTGVLVAALALAGLLGAGVVLVLLLGRGRRPPRVPPAPPPA